MPPTMPGATSGLTPDKDFLFQMLRELEDYPEKEQLSINVPKDVKKALQKYAESSASSKFTTTHLVSWVLLQFAKHNGLIT